MNTCILMAKIASDPELRYTQENQRPITQMLIEIDGLGPNDPPATIRAVGWGNLASEIKEKYHQGDQVIVTGRLEMKNFDSPEGFKEKRAELSISHLYPLSSSPAPNVIPIDSFKPKMTPPPEITETIIDIEPSPTESDKNLDDIPF